MKPQTSVSTPAPRVGVRLKLDRVTYPAGSGHVHATLTLFNHSGAPLTFTETGRQYEWQVRDDAGNVVWDYARGRRFPHWARIRTVPEGGQAVYSYDVPLQRQDGTPLPPGRYTLRAALFGVPYSADADFMVTNKAPAPGVPSLQGRGG